ncbi:uncharacterized protein LOC125524501 [Triticum urartu]|uniref:uncharacterized protein LOC125524501 n=1 Tax=Triticum urartu TaxID=4572 RepID=UPI0020446BD0|nr:uncharacterized protein LOC125524501 [Triticum urartu]
MQQREARRGDQGTSLRRSGNQRQPMRGQGNTTMVGTPRRQPSTMEEHTTTNQGPNRGNNTIGGNAPSWGGGGHQSNPQAQVHHTIIAPSLQTSTMGLNAPSLSGGVRSLIMQGHHTHIASTPENNTTTDASTVGPENRAIHVPDENPRGES